MSGFSYDEEKVAQSIQNLISISDEIEKVGPEIKSGLNFIRNANGINWIDWKQDSIENFLKTKFAEI